MTGTEAARLREKLTAIAECCREKCVTLHDGPRVVQYTRTSDVLAIIGDEKDAAPDARWQALKDYLGERIDADEAVRKGFMEMGDLPTAHAHGALVSANRSTLAKMRELEASS